MNSKTLERIQVGSEEKATDDKTITSFSSSTAIVLRDSKATHSPLPDKVSDNPKKIQSAEEMLKKEISSTITQFPKELITLCCDYNRCWQQTESLFKAVSPPFLQDKILIHIVHAGPFNELKILMNQYQKQNSKAALENLFFNEVFTINEMQGTLIQLPIIGLDQTIRSEQGKEIDKGMAEQIGAWFPDRYTDLMDQAKKAVFTETKEEKESRESTNLKAVENVFGAFIKEDEKAIQKAIDDFEAYVQGIKNSALNKKGYLTDNRYYLNLLHLVHCAFDVLARRGRELKGQWYGEIADHFCFKIIGNVLQSKSSPRLQQILKKGADNILNATQKAERVIDISRDGFLRFYYSSLGIDAYYDIYKFRTLKPSGGRLHSGQLATFFKIYTQLYQPPEYCSLDSKSQAKQLSNTVRL